MVRSFQLLQSISTLGSSSPQNWVGVVTLTMQLLRLEECGESSNEKRPLTQLNISHLGVHLVHLWSGCVLGPDRTLLASHGCQSFFLEPPLARTELVLPRRDIVWRWKLLWRIHPASLDTFKEIETLRNTGCWNLHVSVSGVDVYWWKQDIHWPSVAVSPYSKLARILPWIHVASFVPVCNV